MSNVIDLKTRKAKKSAAKSRPAPRSAKKVGPKRAAKGHTAPAKAKAAKPEKVTRAAQLEALLRRPTGATTAEVAAEMGIAEHSARALISIERRKRGWDVSLEDRRYRIA
jgi:hypothetical protein